MFTRNRTWLSVAPAIVLLAVPVALAVGGTALLAASTTDLSPALLTLIFIPWTLTGAAVVARQPRNPVGWLMAMVGAGSIMAFFVEQYAIRATVLAPGSLPLGPLFAWVSHWIWTVFLVALFYVVLLFPNGRVASPRWRPLLWVSSAVFAFVLFSFAFAPPQEPTAGLTNPFAIEALRGLGAWVEDSYWVFLAVFSLAVLSVITRFRSSRGVERQQLKWAAAGCGIAALLFVSSNYAPGGLLADLGWAVAVPLMPVSFAIAILRHGLYEIDTLINRALVYGALSALLLGTYVLSVLALTGLLRPITGSGDVAVAGSTLGVLALFQPLRARIQRFVDRRFYRARYDAARTIDRFSTRLREQIDLDQLRGELIGVVDDTIKPSHASLWLRGRHRP